jgi:hypothetical protein
VEEVVAVEEVAAVEEEDAEEAVVDKVESKIILRTIFIYKLLKLR